MLIALQQCDIVPRRRRAGLIVCFLTAACLLAGCGPEDEIRQYAAPADPPIPLSAIPPTPTPTAATGEHRHGHGLTWTTPEDWAQEPPADGVTLAILKPPGDTTFNITITRLGMDLSTNPVALLQNINRWRSQIDLEPVEAEAVPPLIEPINPEGGAREPGILVDIPGPDDPTYDNPAAQRIMMGLFVHGGQTWFFKAHDYQSVVDEYEEAFREVLASVRHADGSHHGAPPPATATPPSTAPTTPLAQRDGEDQDEMRMFEARDVRGVVPPEWEQVPNPSDMRIATFIAGPNTEVAVTRFPGSVGGTLANVNRWRGEVGLGPVADMSEQPSREFIVDGQPALVFQFIAPGEDPQRLRTVVGMMPRGEMTWFVKMTGPHSVIDAQTEAFASFILQLKFADSLESGTAR